MSFFCSPTDSHWRTLEVLELQTEFIGCFVPVITLLGNLNAISNHLMMAFVSILTLQFLSFISSKAFNVWSMGNGG